VGTDRFEMRMTEIRNRFAAKLFAKIVETEAALADLCGEFASVKAAYQRFHEMAGIAPTIGFGEIGKAARALDTILIEPYRAARTLTQAELAQTQEALAALRVAADIETTSLVENAP
jgi:HPt (histidine-containing phosphotransfer) domain-containing protein